MSRATLLMSIALVFSTNLFSQADSNDDSTRQIFEKVEFEASFPGGVPGWRNYLEKNLDPSVPVDNGAPSGKYLIVVQFVVDKEGRVSNIKPLTREGYGMEEEVIRIMNKSGLWNPAMQNGRKVNAYRKQPVTFVTTEDGFKIRSATPYILYTAEDNELDIILDQVKSENLEVSISEGTISNSGDGKFIARVSKPGRVIITVKNKKKKNSSGSAMSFEVRQRNVS